VGASTTCAREVEEDETDSRGPWVSGRGRASERATLTGRTHRAERGKGERARGRGDRCRQGGPAGQRERDVIVCAGWAGWPNGRGGKGFGLLSIFIFFRISNSFSFYFLF
jgi:hypothetical protein